MVKYNIIIKDSDKKGKRYKAIINDTKTVHFGSSQHSNYNLHKDKERKTRYLKRHKKNEKWNLSGIKTAGFYSRWLLWGKYTSLNQNIDYLNKRYKSIHIKYVNK